jgi:branched-chain amino acid aminotransferase
MKQPIFYVNGNFVRADQAVLPINDLGIVRGYGVFDMLRTYNRVPFHLHDHLARLARSADQIDLPLPWSLAELESLVLKTHARNDFDNAALRIIVTGGPSPDLGTPQGNPSLVIMVMPISLPPSEHYERGCRATAVETVRERPTAKSLNYIGAIMAVQDATSKGAVEAIYLTKAGNITEGTRSNFFIFRGDQLITPAVDILPGITRQVILKLAPEYFDVVERTVAYDELAEADEAFISSSTKELLPIVQVNDQMIGAGVPGANTLKLLSKFRDYAHSYQPLGSG